MTQTHPQTQGQQRQQFPQSVQGGRGRHQQPPAGGGVQGGQPPAAQVGQRFQTRSYLSDAVRETSVQRLNRALADTIVLHRQVQYAHWNVKGMGFFALHELFEDIADVLADHVDDVAERITSLGWQAMGTTSIAASTSQIPPLSGSEVTGVDFIQSLADRLATHDANLATDIQVATESGDVDTADLLNEVSRDVGKQLWFLEAHLQQSGGQATAPPAGHGTAETHTVTGPGELA